MGKVKEWAMSEQTCQVCGQMFIPWERRNDYRSCEDICSSQCAAEYHEVMNAVADSQQLELEFERKIDM